MKFSGGTFQHSFEEPVIMSAKNPGYILKFEAEDYSSFVSRTISADEGEVKLEVTLRPAKSTTITVLDRQGRPLSGADIGLVSANSWLKLAPGGLSRENPQSGGSMLRTDSSGQFRLPPDDEVTRVIVSHPDGYAEAAKELLLATPTLRLGAWGRLEGTTTSAGAGEAKEFQLRYADNTKPNSVSLDFMRFKVKADSQGRFAFANVPPGHFALVRTIGISQGGGVTSWSELGKTEVEIRPGETTTVKVGGSGYTVKARLQWPANLKRQSDWRIFGSVHTPFPPIPPEIARDPEALRSYQQSPQFQALAKSARHFPMLPSDDGILTAEDVPSGNYSVHVTVIAISPAAGPGRPLAQSEANLMIPSEPSTGTLDMGDLVLRPPTNP